MFSNTITCLDELSGEWKNTFFWMLRSRVLNMVQSAVQSRLLTVHSQSSMQNSVTAWLRGRCKCSSVSRPHELEPQGFRMKRECGNRRRNAEKWHFFQMWTTKRERTLRVSVTIRSKKEKKKKTLTNNLLLFCNRAEGCCIDPVTLQCFIGVAGKGGRQVFVVNSFSQQPHRAHETRWRFSIHCMWMQL